MKRKIFLCLLACVLMASMLLQPVFAAKASQSPLVFDKGELLSEEEEQSLQALAKESTEQTGCTFCVATYKAYDYRDEYWGEDFLSEYAYSYGLADNSGIVLLIVTKDRGEFFYDLYLYGDADRKIKSHEVDLILDDEGVLNIKRGDLEGGIESFLQIATEAYEVQLGHYYLKLFLICLAIALFFGFITCFSVYKSYTAKRKSVDYPLDRYAKLELTEQADLFAGSFVTRRIIQSSSGHGGGGGGGGRGGGGGHAGGR